MSKYGPNGIPKDTVFGVMKVAFERLKVADHKGDDAESDDGILLDLNYDNNVGSMSLSLQILIVGYPIEYEFELLPVARDTVDIIEAGLLDAHDEIAMLKNELAQLRLNSMVPGILTLHSQTVSAHFTLLDLIVSSIKCSGGSGSAISRLGFTKTENLNSKFL